MRCYAVSTLIHLVFTVSLDCIIFLFAWFIISCHYRGAKLRALPLPLAWRGHLRNLPELTASSSWLLLAATEFCKRPSYFGIGLGHIHPSLGRGQFVVRVTRGSHPSSHVDQQTRIQCGRRSAGSLEGMLQVAGHQHRQKIWNGVGRKERTVRHAGERACSGR